MTKNPAAPQNPRHNRDRPVTRAFPTGPPNATGSYVDAQPVAKVETWGNTYQGRPRQNGKSAHVAKAVKENLGLIGIETGPACRHCGGFVRGNNCESCGRFHVPAR